jgi:hypothetical protein
MHRASRWALESVFAACGLWFLDVFGRMARVSRSSRDFDDYASHV